MILLRVKNTHSAFEDIHLTKIDFKSQHNNCFPIFLRIILLRHQIF